MNRRQLLAGALAGTALLTVPDLAFAGVSPKKRRALLGEAWERAARGGRPLLVLLVPRERQWGRGARLGVWLNNASDADLAPLARLEIVCATLPELGRLVPGVEAAEGAWMVLVRVDQDTPTWRSVVVPDVPPEAQAVPYEDFVDDWTKTHEDAGWADIQVAWQEHERRIGQTRLQAELQSFRASIGRVLASEGLTEGASPQLASEARQRWVKTAPPGSHWATSAGCGTHIEPNADDDPDQMNRFAVGCGMGRVEAYARRFLHFWDVA